MNSLHPSVWQDVRYRLKPLLVACVVLGVAGIGGALLVYNPWLALASIAVMSVALALLAWPDGATLLVIFLIYSNAAVVAVRFHDVPYVLGAAVPVLLVHPLISYLVLRRQPLVFDPIVFFLVLFLGIQLVGLLFVEQTNRVGSGFDRVVTFLIEGLGLYFLMINTIRTQRMVRAAVWTLVIVCLLLGTLSFYQQMTGTFHKNYAGFAQMSNAAFGTGEETLQGEVAQPRLAGPLGDQNRYAQLMIMIVPLALFRVWSERSPLLRLLGGVATLFILIGMALTFSRGALFALVLLVLVMVLFRYIKLYQVALVLLILWLIIQAVPQFGGRLVKLQNLSISAMLSDDTQQSGLEGTDGSTQNRVAQQLAALYMFRDHPLIGVGTGFYRVNYQEYAREVGMMVKNADRESHTLYLGVAAENGVLGLGCILAIFYLMLRNLRHVRQRWLVANPQLANLATSFFLAIVGYMGAAVFLHFAYIRFFWLVMGLAGATYQISQTEEAAVTKALPLSYTRQAW